MAAEPKIDQENLQFLMNQPDQETLRHRAAAYVRMSRDHQQYSTCNQLEVIRGFARRRNLEVVKEYSDEGKSGLKIKGRAALSQMIGDVLTKRVNYSHILVYDVSRWGRFQDPDEAAHYEFVCRQAGVTVHYCAEQFENDGCLTSAITKNFKRAMAGEFSRELSAKVCQGAARMIRMGFKQGGTASIGLRRMLVDQNGQHKGILNPGEQKSLQTDRVIFVPGPKKEIEAVRWIFQTFVDGQKGVTEIARLLNQQGVSSLARCPWTDCKIRNLLHNEKYIGNLVYARRTSKLGSRNVPNPPEKWIRIERAFDGIVSRELFFKAQELFEGKRQQYKFTEAEMLEKLRALLTQHGYLTTELIDESSETPNAPTYCERFGSLRDAYRLIGYQPCKDYHHFEIKRRLNQINQKLIGVIIRQIERLGANATWNGSKHMLLLNQELRVWVVFIRHNVTHLGASWWLIRRRVQIKPDFTMAVRMARNNEDIQDYYLLPGMENIGGRISFSEQNGIYLDAYRFESLDYLVGLAARVKLSEGRFS